MSKPYMLAGTTQQSRKHHITATIAFRRFKCTPNHIDVQPYRQEIENVDALKINVTRSGFMGGLFPAGIGRRSTGYLGDAMLRPSPNYGTPWLLNDDVSLCCPQRCWLWMVS